MGRGRLEVARQPFHLPVAITRRVEAPAAIKLGWRFRFGLGPARLGFLKRPSRRRRQFACARFVSFDAASRARKVVAHTLLSPQARCLPADARR
jgi:hypothetical protein